MAQLMVLDKALELGKDPGARNFVRETHNFGFGVVKTLVLAPFVIVSIILLIAALIAVGNGAYTMGTFITFLIGGAMLYGCYWIIAGAGTMNNERTEPQYSPPPQYYQQQYGRQQGYGAPQRRRSVQQGVRPTGRAEDSDMIN